jgi:hypothetical protein
LLRAHARFFLLLFLLSFAHTHTHINIFALTITTKKKTQGEKIVHRYYLGMGKTGRRKIARLIRKIEALQGFKRDPHSGAISVCRKKYGLMRRNCSEFAREMEEFTVRELEGQLMHITAKDPMFPCRRLVEWEPSAWRDSQEWVVCNATLLLLCICISIAGFVWQHMELNGHGVADNFSDHEDPHDIHFQRPDLTFLWNWVEIPMSVRLRQTHNPSIRRYACKMWMS